MNDYSYTVLLHLNDKLNDPNALKHTHKKKKAEFRQTWTKEGNVSTFKVKIFKKLVLNSLAKIRLRHEKYTGIFFY